MGILIIFSIKDDLIMIFCHLIRPISLRKRQQVRQKYSLLSKLLLDKTRTKKTKPKNPTSSPVCFSVLLPTFPQSPAKRLYLCLFALCCIISSFGFLLLYCWSHPRQKGSCHPSQSPPCSSFSETSPAIEEQQWSTQAQAHDSERTYTSNNLFLLSIKIDCDFPLVGEFSK